ncbi:MAG: YggU family protein [Armatimonadetes bacterium]|nr:YggU family protein [Armatimonadota bacterium]
MARLEVKVTPRARRNEIVGWHEGRMLVVKIAAPPIGGQANDELVSFLAEQLGVAASDIQILRGYTSKQKVLEIAGLSDDDIRRRLGV